MKRMKRWAAALALCLLFTLAAFVTQNLPSTGI